MTKIDDAIDAAMEAVSRVADDTKEWSQADSVDIYESVADQCRDRARLIRSEME